MKDFSQKDIENIVNDEMKKFLSSELDTIMAKILKKNTSDSREVTKDLVKQGLSKLAEFLYIRRSVWQNDIK